MSAIDGPATERLQWLERQVEALSSRVNGLVSLDSSPGRRKQTRTAKTVAVGGSYPSTGNTFGIVFVDGSYTETAGDQTPTYTDRAAAVSHYVHNVANEHIAEGEYIEVWNEKNQWWCDKGGGSGGSGSIAIARYSITFSGDFDGADGKYYIDGATDEDTVGSPGVSWNGTSFDVSPGGTFEVSCKVLYDDPVTAADAFTHIYDPQAGNPGEILVRTHKLVILDGASSEVAQDILEHDNLQGLRFHTDGAIFYSLEASGVSSTNVASGSFRPYIWSGQQPLLSGPKTWAVNEASIVIKRLAGVLS